MLTVRPEHLSLLKWLERAARHEIPAVRAEQIAAILPRLICGAVDGQLTRVQEVILRQVAAEMRKAADEGWVVRYDCCAGQRLKGAMSKPGRTIKPDLFYFDPDDPRLIDVIMDLDLDEPMAVLRRPWIPAPDVAGYPVEFRAFVKYGQVIGVSSYYPQRPLPDDPWTAHAMSVLEATKRMIESDDESFTLDWIMTEKLDLMLLEGGPPHMPEWGAHPCCFKAGEIDGIALSNRNEELE